MPPDGYQQTPQRYVIRHSRMANRPQKNGVKRAELLEAVGGHHSAGSEIGVATPVKFAPDETETEAAPRSFEDSDAFGHNFAPDAIPSDYGNFVGSVCD